MSKPINNEESGDNRREYYRIDDQVLLSYRVLGSGEITEKLAEFAEYSPLWSSLYATLEGNNPEQRILLESITRSSPQLSRYLQNMDDKLNLLARILMSERADMSSRSVDQVNISGSGIGFAVDEPIAEGSSLELKVSLFPSYLTLLAYGRLIRCEKDSGVPEKPWSIATEFVAIKEEDREALINHIMRRQANLIRKADDTE